MIVVTCLLYVPIGKSFLLMPHEVPVDTRIRTV